jgi:hypothetical protein
VSVVLEWIIVRGFVRLLLKIVVSVFHRFMASDSPFGIQLYLLGVHSLDLRNNKVKMTRLTGIAMIFFYIGKVLF